MRQDKVSPHAGFRQDGPIREFECSALEGRDDRVAHVADEDCHGGHGDEGPDDEEGFACVGSRREVTVANGEERDVAEVESLEVA